MKKILFVLIMMLLGISMTGCNGRTLVYYGNLGYDLSKTKHDEIEFRIYHSNTADHKWELLTTLASVPGKDHFCDLRLSGMENKLVFTLADNYVVKEKECESYYSDTVETFEYDVHGFKGFISSYQTFDVKDIKGEQNYRLYPISNKNGVIFADTSMENAYDPECENMDNILITITIR